MTSIDESGMAATFISRLCGQAQVIAKTLCIQVLTSSKGLTRLLKELDKKSGLDKVSLFHNNGSDFSSPRGTEALP